MAANSSHDEQTKKKLNAFLSEMLRFGCVKGFRHFDLYLRGREELGITIINDLLSATPAASPSASMNKALPRNESSLMLSARTQRYLSGLGYIDVGLPPASPSEREILQASENHTVFLLAGYGKYCCPYVWVRSNHERLVKMTGTDAAAKDNPLKLKTTSKWAYDEVHCWDIIAELIAICTSPAPANPFAIEFSYFESLKGTRGIIASGAMLHCLQKVMCNPSTFYFEQVAKDHERLARFHFQQLRSLHHLGVVDSAQPDTYTPPSRSVSMMDEEC